MSSSTAPAAPFSEPMTPREQRTKLEWHGKFVQTALSSSTNVWNTQPHNRTPQLPPNFTSPYEEVAARDAAVRKGGPRTSSSFLDRAADMLSQANASFDMLRGTPKTTPNKPNTGFIEEHVDNDSVITFIIMLGVPGKDFLGGKNNFARGCKHSIRRQTQLMQGDMVLFRGERLRHSITPVTKGCRIILQGEFSKV